MKLYTCLCLFIICISCTLSFKSTSRKSLYNLRRSRATKINSGFDDYFTTIYSSYLLNNPILSDMFTATISYTLSDTIAQFSEIIASKSASDGDKNLLLNSISTDDGGKVKDFNLDRLIKFLVFGFLDGAVSHGWFVGLDEVISGDDILSVIYKVTADTLIYTPLWCVWFIFGISILEGSLWRKYVSNELAKEWKELAFIDLK